MHESVEYRGEAGLEGAERRGYDMDNAAVPRAEARIHRTNPDQGHHDTRSHNTMDCSRATCIHATPTYTVNNMCMRYYNVLLNSKPSTSQIEAKNRGTSILNCES